MTRAMLAAALLAGCAAVPAPVPRTPAPEGANVYIISPSHGAVVSSPVTVRFGLSGMGVAPAGTQKKNTGHHHLFINRPPLGKGPDGADELDANIPADDNHVHFGGGQTETTVTLKPGKNTLQLVLGDKDHIPHKPPVVSETIAITVK